MRPYIGDGHDSTFYIAGEDGLYPNCRFNGRLMGGHQTAAILRETTDKPTDADTIFAKAISSRLTGWSYQGDSGQWRPFDDHDGGKLEVNVRNVGGLQFNLLCKLRDIVLGIQPADVDPATGTAAKTPDENEKN